jgi:hypothetical protein
MSIHRSPLPERSARGECLRFPEEVSAGRPTPDRSGHAPLAHETEDGNADR